MAHMIHRIFFYTGILLFLFVSAGSAQLLLNNGHLSLKSDSIPLKKILDEIGRQGNIPITIKGALVDKKISIDFGPLPLEKGLKRILKNVNYTAIQDQHGNITELVIFGAMPTQFSKLSSQPQTPHSITIPAGPADAVGPSEQQPYTGTPDIKEEEKNSDQKTGGTSPDATAQPAEAGPKEGT